MTTHSRGTDADYHLQRARAERNMAYRAENAVAGDAHMGLAALHLERALLLQALRSGPVGNVHPLRREHQPGSIAA